MHLHQNYNSKNVFALFITLHDLLRGHSLKRIFRLVKTYQASTLSKRFSTIYAIIGFVTSMYPGMSFQCTRLSEGFATYLTAEWSHILCLVFTWMADHGGLMTKKFVADGTFKRFLWKADVRFIRLVFDTLR